MTERFWTKVDKRGHDDCWLWTAHFNGNGYGEIKADAPQRRNLIASRVAWELTSGPIPIGLMVLHKCDTPACVNPRHLRLGDQLDNMGEASQRDRTASGSRHGVSKITEADALEIKRRLAKGEAQEKIGRDYGLSQTAVGFIKRGKTWRRVRLNGFQES